VAKIKKIAKYTKVLEMEAEKKAFYDETIRLRHLLE
jgi:hypothetical protein